MHVHVYNTHVRSAEAHARSANTHGRSANTDVMSTSGECDELLRICPEICAGGAPRSANTQVRRML